MVALMWTKDFLFFSSLEFPDTADCLPLVMHFLAAFLNVKKSFWMTAAFLFSICCQTFLIASTSKRQEC